MTFSLKWYCWCSKPRTPKLISPEKKMHCDLWLRNWLILASLKLHSRPAPIPSQQAQCCSFKGEMKIHFRSSSQVVAQHVNLCFHAIIRANVYMFQCRRLERFRWFQTVTKNYSWWERGKKLCESCLCTCEACVSVCVWACVQQAFDKTAQSVLVQTRQETKKEICHDQAYTSDGPTSSLGLWILHLITMLQWVSLSWVGLCLCVSVCKPHWPCWMRILQTGLACRL